MFEPSGFQVEYDKLAQASHEAKDLHSYLDQLGVQRDGLTLLERFMAYEGASK